MNGWKLELSSPRDSLGRITNTCTSLYLLDACSVAEAKCQAYKLAKLHNAVVVALASVEPVKRGIHFKHSPSRARHRLALNLQWGDSL